MDLTDLLKSSPLPPVEEIAGPVLEELVKLNRDESAGNFAALYTGGSPQNASTAAKRAVLSAFAWLQNRDLLAPATQPGWYFVTDKGREIGTAANLKSYLAKQNISEPIGQLAQDPEEDQNQDSDENASHDFRSALQKLGINLDEPQSSAPEKAKSFAGQPLENVTDAADSIEVSSISDAPAQSDSLGFAPYVQAIARFLLSADTKPPLTISIEGEWGSGKSSFMLQLRNAMGGEPLRHRLAAAWKKKDPNETTPRVVYERLREAWQKRRQFHVQFNPWRHDKEESLWAAFALEFLRQIRQQRFFLRRWWGNLILFRYHYSWKGWLEGLRAVITWLILLVVVIGIPYEVFVRGAQWTTRVTALLSEKASGTKEGEKGSERSAAKKAADKSDIDPLFNALLSIGGNAASLVVVLSIWIKANQLIGNPLEIDLKKYLRSPNYEERITFVERFHEDFRHIVDAYAGRQKVFVFIDDLDRCEVPKAAELMKAVNLLIADDPRLIFIVGMDREKVISGLAVKYEKLLPYVAREVPTEDDREAWKRRAGLDFGQFFLQKFIQLPFRVPEPNLENYSDFLKAISVPMSHSGETRPATDAIVREENSERSHIASIRADAESSDQREERRERELQFHGDSDKVRRVAMMIASALDPNPRRLKQFINLFRLQAYISNELGFFDADQPDGRRVTFEQLGKFVAIGLKWPALLSDFAEQSGLLGELERFSGSEQTGMSPLASRWIKEKKLPEFFQYGIEGNYHDYTLSNPTLYHLLRISPQRIGAHAKRRPANFPG